MFVSPLDKKLYNNRLFLNPNGKHLIFPVEITCYDNKKLTHFNLNNTNELKNILIIANLDQQSHQRDILKFIHIFNNYCKKNNSIKFHFHGKTEFFKKNIVINDFKNQLIFHSWVDNLVDFYKTFDLVVSPIQNSTGLQTKYLQTFISKTPLALLKNTSYGFSPSILNGYNCIMSNSINGLVDLIHHARDLENISLNAFDYVSENYSIEKISKKVNYQLVD